MTDEVREFLQTADPMADIQAQWNTETQKGTKFMKLYGDAIKSTIASTVAMIAVSVAIQAAMKAWDKVNITVEEQQEKYDELEESLKSLNDEYNTLSSKDYTSLTKSEKERLSYLEARIEAEKELLDIQKHNIYREEIGKKFTDQFDENNQYTKLANAKNYSVTDGQTYGVGSTEGIEIEKIINSYDRASQSVNKFRSAVTELDADNFEYLAAQGLLTGENTRSDLNNELVDAERERRSVLSDLIIKQDELTTDISNYTKEYEHMQEMILSGLLTEAELNDAQEIKNAWEYKIFEAERYLDVLEGIQLTSDIDNLGKVFNTIESKDYFNFSGFDNDTFKSFFQGTKESQAAFEEFQNVIAESPDDIVACSTAFDELIATWAVGDMQVTNITDGLRQSTIATLKDKGVKDAATVAEYALAAAKRRTFIETQTANGATEIEVEKLQKEALALGFAENETYDLIRAIIQFNMTQIDVTNDIASLHSLQRALLDVEAAAYAAANAKALKALGWTGEQGYLVNESSNKSAYRSYVDKGGKLSYEAWKNSLKQSQKPNDDNGFSGGSSYVPKLDNGSSGGGSDPFKAEIDKYEKYTRVIDELSSTLSDLNRAYEHTDDIEERIALKNKEIELYAQQQKAIEDLNNARDEEIGANVNKLRGKGFKIDYDPLTDSLVIHNKELINTMKASDKTKEELWKLIEASEELNSANKESTEQWKELSYSILESRDALEELHNERFDEAIADAEHLIELFSKRGDVVDEDLQLMGGIMTALEKELQDLMKQGTEADKDRIKELQKMWMDYYDSRIERENEILEKQLEDRDGVLSAIDNLFNERIENIDKEIKALQKTNEERKSAIELQKAQAALDAAKSQKTRKVLIKGKGFVWEADDDAIKEAEENLADLEFEQSIETLEKQKESLEEIKNMWAEIPDEFEKYQNKLLAEERLGADWEDDVLDGRISVYNDFKDEYFDIQKKIYENTKKLNEHMADEYQKMMDQFAKMIAMFNVPEAAVGGAVGSSNKSWYVNKDGKAPSQANVGDLVYTKGGIYRIDSKDANGKFKSTRIDATPQTIPEGMWGKEIQTVSSTIASIYDELKNLQKGGNVNLLNRPEVSSKVMQNAGWDTEDGSISTVNTSTYSNRDGSVAMNFTPIQVDKNGKLVRVLGEDELQRYAEAVIDGAHDDYLGLKIGQTFTGKNAISNAEAEAQRIHKLHEALTTDETGVNFNDSLAINALSTEGLIREAEDVNERIKASILSSDELRDYMKKNTDVTWKDVDAILENADFTHRLSGETDDNTDATDDNTQALRDLIYKLANLEFEVPLEEMTLENFDDNIMDETDQAYIKELQKAWNLAMEQGNVELANQIHAMADEARMRYLDDDPNNDYNAIAESISKLADSKYEYSYSTQIGGKNGDSEATQKYLDNINWLRGKADWSDDFIDRLDNVVDAIENGSGLTAKVYEDQYGRTSTVIEYTDKKTPNTNKTSGSSGSKKTSGQQAMDNHGMSDSDRNAIAAAQKKYNEAKTQAEKDAAHREAEAIRNKYGYSGGTDGSENIKTTSANTRSVSENTKATTYNADSTNDNTDSIDSNTDSVDKNTAEHAKGYKVDVNVNVSGGSSGGSSGGGGSKGNGKGNGGSPSDSGSYKMDNNPNSPTFGVKVKQKAKGGVNLRGDVYNVDEKGPELLIEPDEGRFVRIRKGGSVIPADVSKKLWEFGANPKAFMDNIVSKNIIKVNPQIVDVTAAATSGSGTVQNNYHIGSMALPNVQDVNGFIRDIQNLPNLAKQYMTKK